MNYGDKGSRKRKRVGVRTGKYGLPNVASEKYLLMGLSSVFSDLNLNFPLGGTTSVVRDFNEHFRGVSWLPSSTDKPRDAEKGWKAKIKAENETLLNNSNDERCRDRWLARMFVVSEMRMKFIGCYASGVAAAIAYDRVAHRLYGINAILNYDHRISDREKWGTPKYRGVSFVCKSCRWRASVTVD